jgi:hypothetical protein
VSYVDLNFYLVLICLFWHFMEEWIFIKRRCLKKVSWSWAMKRMAFQRAWSFDKISCRYLVLEKSKNGKFKWRQQPQLYWVNFEGSIETSNERWN